MTLQSTTFDASTLAGYQAGRSGAALHEQDDHARLWLAGADRVPFLQRMTTNDVRLRPGQGTVTILTSPTARILVTFVVLAQEEGLLLLAGPGEGPKAYNALHSQIFFGDNVALEGRGNALAQFGLYGPAAGDLLAAAGVPGLADLAAFAWRDVNLAGSQVTVQRNEGLGSQSFTLLAPAAAGEAVRAALLAAGAVLLAEEAYQALRIEAGVPAPSSELTDQVNPLEAGLRRFCDDHKGCYTGQEIIARQITYDKITTQLVGLLPDSAVTPGSDLLVEGRRAGFISSAIHSPALNRPIALAFLRRPHHEPGTAVVVGSPEAGIPAQVVALPFVAS